MITVLRSQERGQTQWEWLDSKHSFSFGEYYNPYHMGFHHLRVINQDLIRPGTGFPSHAHHDMEIITYVLSGSVTHHDSMGNKATINPGEIQLMSAGTGVTHSEYNSSKNQPLELLQIWIRPNQKGLAPSYQQIKFTKSKLNLLIAPNKDKAHLAIHQDLKAFYVKLQKNEKLNYPLQNERVAWIQQLTGNINIDTLELKAGDGAQIERSTVIQLQAKDDSECLLFDMAGN